MSCPARIYPLRKPKLHRPPVPRWQLSLGSNVSHVFTVYVGVQNHSDDEAAGQASVEASAAIRTWLNADDGPSAFEQFEMIDGCDAKNAAIWVCYWIEEAKYRHSLETLSLQSIYSRLPSPGRTSIGIWCEAFTTESTRLETNYSGLDYLPGLAKLPGVSTEEHESSAYWGAARDRIPDSAHDLFPASSVVEHPTYVVRGLGQHLVGTNFDNMVHIRSGQFWENCSQDEADAYQKELEPTLHAGLTYLWGSPRETGAYGLRYLRNKEPSASFDDRPRKETCGAGFFRSLEALETWAKNHPSHLAIYRGALAHYKTFEGRRKFRTWHEVSVLREGSARFEYLNCLPQTGVIQCIPLKVEDLEGGSL